VSPVELHKYAYWNAHGMNLHVMYDKSPYVDYTKHPHSPEDCVKLTRNLLPICNSGIMTFLTIGGQVHNLSVFLYDLADPTNGVKYLARVSMGFNTISPPAILRMGSYLDFITGVLLQFKTGWVPENAIST